MIKMKTLSIFSTFLYDLEQVWIDMKNFFIDLFNNIYGFLNTYIPKDILIALGICLAAIFAIAIFRAVINK